VEGLNIQGSPFDVRVVAPFGIPNAPIQTFSDIAGPWGVAFNRRGEIIVTGDDVSTVSIYSPSRKQLRSFSAQGSDPGQFMFPAGVTVDDQDNILVADKNNHRIQKFTSDGHFLVSVCTKGVKPLQFNCPTGIAYNTHNKKMYVVDSANHRIQVLNSDLTFYCISGGKESGKNGLFSYPWDVSCDGTGNVYIADTINKSLQLI
jgi:tripartite motif-containing protein 2/3/tripartite motif-containing protein 71